MSFWQSIVKIIPAKGKQVNPEKISQFDEDEYNDDAMFGLDKLYQVSEKEMSQPLHRHTGAITFRSRNFKELGKGSGCLISPNLVLTVAHNVCHRALREVYYEIKFYPGQYGELQRYY